MTVTPEKVLATIRKKLDWSNNSARIDPTDLKSLAASANNSVWCRKGNNFSPTAFADVPNSRIREKKKKKKNRSVFNIRRELLHRLRWMRSTKRYRWYIYLWINNFISFHQGYLHALRSLERGVSKTKQKKKRNNERFIWNITILKHWNWNFVILSDDILLVCFSNLQKKKRNKRTCSKLVGNSICTYLILLLNINISDRKEWKYIAKSIERYSGQM